MATFLFADCLAFSLSMITTQDLLRFWARAIPDLQVHPDDDAALRESRHSLVLDALVGPWMGPVRTATVVLLTLNGGYNGVEREEAKMPSVREAMARNLGGDTPLPDFATNRGGREWTERLLARFNLTYELAASKVACVNLLPYRSVEGSRDLRMVEHLKSARLIWDWAHYTLFPEAEAGERVVICTRSVRAWWLDPDVPKRGQSLFVLKFTRRLDWYLDQGSGPTRDDIILAVHAAIGR